MCQKALACRAPWSPPGKACPKCGCYYPVADPDSYEPYVSEAEWRAGGLPDGWNGYRSDQWDEEEAA